MTTGSPYSDPRLVLLATTLRDHVPADTREQRSLQRTLTYLDWLPRPFDEEADPTHLTASAIVVAPGPLVLLHRHRRLGIWLQPGGHIEDGEEPAEAAVRETLEETGVPARHPEPGPRLLHVDVHEGPRAHLHLDLRYLLLAEPTDPSPGPGESPLARWVGISEAAGLADHSLGSALDRLRRTAGLPGS